MTLASLSFQESRYAPTFRPALMRLTSNSSLHATTDPSASAMSFPPCLSPTMSSSTLPTSSPGAQSIWPVPSLPTILPRWIQPTCRALSRATRNLLGSSTALCVTPMTTSSLMRLNRRALRPRSTSRSKSTTCGKGQLQSFVRRLLTCPHASVQPRASLARHIRLAGSVTLETSRATRRQSCFSPHVQHSRLCLHCQHLQRQRLLPPWRPSVTTSALADSDPTLLSR